MVTTYSLIKLPPVTPVAFNTTLIPHYVLSSQNIPHYQSLEHIRALYTVLVRFGIKK